VGVAGLLRAGALPVVPDASAFATTRWWTVALYTPVWIGLQLLRAARWQLLLAPVGRVPLRRVMAVSLIGYGALAVLPFRMGEVVRPALIRQKGQLSLLAASGTVGAERVIDGLFLSLVLVVGLLASDPLSPLPDRIGELPVQSAVIPGAAYSAAGMFAVLFVAMAVFYWRRTWARTLAARIGRMRSSRLASWIATAVERVADGLRFLPRLCFAGPFVALTAVYWFGFAASTWLLLWGTGIDSPTLLQATVITGVIALGVIVPNAPGFFGAFQLSAYAGMVMFFPLAEVTGPGAAFVFLIYVIQIGLAIVLAALALLAERLSPRDALTAS
jgi:hypothetical protein